MVTNFSPILKATAPAKVNLALHVHGKNARGYHDLESLIVFTAFGDVLRCQLADELELEVEGPFADFVGNKNDNLVLRAASMLQKASGCTQGARIKLEKNIPVGAGLGGGSSDAATALKLLRSLWQVAVPDAVLYDIAKELGADISVCLLQQTAFAEGEGEILTPYSLKGNYHLVLLYPNRPLKTQDVFRELDKNAYYQGVSITDMFQQMSELKALQRCKNSLQRAAITQCSSIGALLLELETSVYQPDLVRMSGSGSSCFALFEDASQAQRMANELAKTQPAWWLCCTCIL